jgi:enediyne polyketide synthase
LAQILSEQTKESFAASATRVWTGIECLKKVGAMSDAPLTFEKRETQGWIMLNSGRLKIATYLAAIHGASGPMAVGIISSES